MSMDSHYNPDLLNQGLIPKDSISLRDQFAMAALASINSEEISNHMAKLGHRNLPLEQVIAGIAYQYADALLAERDKKR